MNNLNENDKKILEIIQHDIPLVSNPFKAIAKKCDLKEEYVINRLKFYHSNNIIRELSGILNAEKMGYKSTLVALAANEKTLDSLVNKINHHPGVSHNYLRKNKFNIWFTLTIQQEKDFKHEIKKIFNYKNGFNFLILPSIQTFKINVNFKLSDIYTDIKKAEEHNQNNNFIPGEKSANVILTDLDKEIIKKLQQNIKFVEEPWKDFTESIGISEQKLFNSINNLKNNGVIKRIAGVLRHRKIGFNFNGMICFNIPANKILAAGNKLAEFKEVTHCYQRESHPNWNYSIYAMVHTKTESECNSLIKRIASEIDCDDYITLYSTKEFKKERVKYFL